VALCEKGEGATLQVVAIMKKGHEVDLNSNLAIKEDNSLAELDVDLLEKFIKKNTH